MFAHLSRRCCLLLAELLKPPACPENKQYLFASHPDEKGDPPSPPPTSPRARCASLSFNSVTFADTDLLGLRGDDRVEEDEFRFSVWSLEKSRRGRVDKPAQLCHRKPLKQENELET